MRPRGVIVYRMPEQVAGPVDNYALLIRADGAMRMVHSEGVAYSITDDKPWCWTDYQPNERKWTATELRALAGTMTTTDLADWVRTFGARLESNFDQVWKWATS